MKVIIPLICIILLASCGNNSSNNDLGLSSFIKPMYLYQESSLNCNLADNETLNSIERFIPQLVDSFSDSAKTEEELFFLFPVSQDGKDTQAFKILFKHQDQTSLDNLMLNLAKLSFDKIANCDNSRNQRSSLRLNTNPINGSPVIAEILECKYLDGFNYATMKLILEQFTDALKKNNFPVDIFYSENNDSSGSFQWTNIFLSIDSRRAFVESWQQLEISKEIQSLLLEQSICESSNTFRQYKVL